MTKIRNLILLISFLEGSSLMIAEVLSSKIIAPYFGTSLTVWTSIFICTLLALAIGYFVGGKLSTQVGNEKKVFLILLLATVYFFLVNLFAGFVMDLFLDLGVLLGSVLSLFIILSPFLFALALVSPILIKILSVNFSEAGKNASIVYTVSTIGGILATLFTGLYFIPFYGIRQTIIVTTILLVIATFLMFRVSKLNSTHEK